jgi:hypothetical protein
MELLVVSAIALYLASVKDASNNFFSEQRRRSHGHSVPGELARDPMRRWWQVLETVSATMVEACRRAKVHCIRVRAAWHSSTRCGSAMPRHFGVRQNVFKRLQRLRREKHSWQRGTLFAAVRKTLPLLPVCYM